MPFFKKELNFTSYNYVTDTHYVLKVTIFLFYRTRDIQKPIQD